VGPGERDMRLSTQLALQADRHRSCVRTEGAVCSPAAGWSAQLCSHMISDADLHSLELLDALFCPGHSPFNSLPQSFLLTFPKLLIHFGFLQSFLSLPADLDGCASIQLRGPGRQLASFDLRAVFSTDRDHHTLAFMRGRCPPGEIRHPLITAHELRRRAMVAGWHRHTIPVLHNARR